MNQLSDHWVAIGEVVSEAHKVAVLLQVCNIALLVKGIINFC